jgi:hypothetical protein
MRVRRVWRDERMVGMCSDIVGLRRGGVLIVCERWLGIVSEILVEVQLYRRVQGVCIVGLGEVDL